MSYFDDASLVMIPSGYKTSKVYSVKPLDGSGDLTFTRSNDTATRVNSAGLIEKVRTNLATYSNDVSNAAWAKLTDGTYTITSETIADPFGNSVAVKKVTLTSGGYLVLRNILGSATTSPTTGSVYIKKTVAGSSVSIDLSDASTATAANNTNWQRLVSINPASVYGSGTFLDINITTINEPVYVAYAQIELSDFGATDYIATTSAAVSVGPVANVPRLDYLGSSCPRLLLEPQRTNLCVYSEALDNAVWTKVNSTVTANNTTAPDGYLGADRINEDTANNAHGVERVTSGAAGTYTFSIFIKKGTRRYAGMRAVVNGYSNRYFSLLDLDTGLIVSNNTIGTGVTWTSSVETYGNGWYRLIITGNHTSSNITLLAALSDSANPTYNAAVPYYQGSTSENGFFWGAQIELGSYATSYIPTLGAAVTRGADAASKTGISSLIGQTEGVVFIDINRSYITSSYDRFFAVDDADAGIYRTGIFILPEPTINGRVYVELRNNSTGVFGYTYNSTTTQRLKIAVAYKNNDMAIYINGTQMATSSASLTFAHTLSRVLSSGNGQSINQTLLFPTRLSNSDLAALTTI